MNRIIEWWETEKIRKTFFEAVYLMFFFVFLLQRVLWTTMFTTWYPEYFQLFLRILMVFFIAAKLGSGKRFSLSEIIWFLLVTMALVAVWQKAGYDELLDVALLIAGAYETDFKKILKVYLLVEIAVMIVTMTASQLGLVEDLIYHRGDNIRMAFGYVYPTDYTAHIFYIVLAWCFLRGAAVSYQECCIFALLGAFALIFCDARMNAGCLMLTAVVFAVLRFWNTKAKETFTHVKKVKIEKKISGIFVAAPVICATVMLSLTWFYSEENSFLSLINRWLSNRLSLGKRGFTEFGVSLFGQWLPIVGNGGSTEPRDNYFFLDSSYVNILLSFGMVLFCVVMAMHLWNQIQLRRNAMYAGMLVLCLLFVQCMVEHHMMEIAYNPFLFMILADKKSLVGIDNNGERKGRKTQKN